VRRAGHDDDLGTVAAAAVRVDVPDQPAQLGRGGARAPVRRLGHVRLELERAEVTQDRAPSQGCRPHPTALLEDQQQRPSEEHADQQTGSDVDPQLG
jgi:hypothetical protein